MLCYKTTGLDSPRNEVITLVALWVPAGISQMFYLVGMNIKRRSGDAQSTLLNTGDGIFAVFF